MVVGGLRVLLLDYGEDVEGKPAGEREGELVKRPQAGQQHWRHDGVDEQWQRIAVGTWERLNKTTTGQQRATLKSRSHVYSRHGSWASQGRNLNRTDRQVSLAMCTEESVHTFRGVDKCFSLTKADA